MKLWIDLSVLILFIGIVKSECKWNQCDDGLERDFRWRKNGNSINDALLNERLKLINPLNRDTYYDSMFNSHTTNERERNIVKGLREKINYESNENRRLNERIGVPIERNHRENNRLDRTRENRNSLEEIDKSRRNYNQNERLERLNQDATQNNVENRRLIGDFIRNENRRFETRFNKRDVTRGDAGSLRDFSNRFYDALNKETFRLFNHRINNGKNRREIRSVQALERDNRENRNDIRLDRNLKRNERENKDAINFNRLLMRNKEQDSREDNNHLNLRILESRGNKMIERLNGNIIQLFNKNRFDRENLKSMNSERRINARFNQEGRLMRQNNERELVLNDQRWNEIPNEVNRKVNSRRNLREMRVSNRRLMREERIENQNEKVEMTRERNFNDNRINARALKNTRLNNLIRGLEDNQRIRYERRDLNDENLQFRYQFDDYLINSLSNEIIDKKVSVLNNYTPILIQALVLAFIVIKFKSFTKNSKFKEFDEILATPLKEKVE